MQVEEDEKETPTEWRKGKKERQIYRQIQCEEKVRIYR